MMDGNGSTGQAPAWPFQMPCPSASQGGPSDPTGGAELSTSLLQGGLSPVKKDPSGHWHGSLPPLAGVSPDY